MCVFSSVLSTCSLGNIKPLSSSFFVDSLLYSIIRVAPPPPLSRGERLSPHLPGQTHWVLCKGRGHLPAGHLFLGRPRTGTFRDWSSAQRLAVGFLLALHRAASPSSWEGLLLHSLFSILIQHTSPVAEGEGEESYLCSVRAPPPPANGCVNR